MFSCRAGFDRIFAPKTKTEIYHHFSVSPFLHFAILPFRVLNTPTVRNCKMSSIVSFSSKEGDMGQVNTMLNCKCYRLLNRR